MSDGKKSNNAGENSEQTQMTHCILAMFEQPTTAVVRVASKIGKEKRNSNKHT